MSLADFAVGEVLGAGAMGTVYGATHLASGMPVARCAQQVHAVAPEETHSLLAAIVGRLKHLEPPGRPS